MGILIISSEMYATRKTRSRLGDYAAQEMPNDDNDDCLQVKWPLAYISVTTTRISTLVRGIDLAGEPRFAYINQRVYRKTSNLQRTAAVASTRRAHVVSVVAVVAA